ncbi:hypothetical protein ND861_14535 [Leptospira sp. 2 VSF19]|uniref:Lipoprotein n=1 Tax=Leptospira soteropolitanensis TaxID=2950025 RepID=A0AAW5VIM5_9LEPT|nr:hypothetical protein [Leptospira soteropolitanensis]MCW7493935.1 hypothetical protein [Leptospira soteropolitanensis]MCW7501529.1 hypothetical protein [Leptospira soteropolitanensis]MCW7523709.1 hypothetical protein [Leptospira soteropolitanensis]MCW7527572.1 hypothetical protein [Leptospira soteropolitanensis]MCW7531426.1 hypothetical protein [Leptospira soteropolitanensis]
MLIGFVLGFAILGAVISSVCGFLVGNRLGYIFFVSLISTFAFGGLGFGVFSVLQKKVPEFLEFLSTFSIGGLGGDGHSEDYDQEHGGMESTRSESAGSDDFGVQQVGDQAMDAKLAMAKSGKFGDHIIVDKIAIKNEPKLMAEAIRTMMAKDDPQDG